MLSIAGLADPECSADMNFDEAVNVSDAVELFGAENGDYPGRQVIHMLRERSLTIRM